MVAVNVLQSGRLRLDGFCRGYPTAHDGTCPLTPGEGSTLREAIHGRGVPADRVVMTTISGQQFPVDARLGSGDRVILIPVEGSSLKELAPSPCVGKGKIPSNWIGQRLTGWRV